MTKVITSHVLRPISCSYCYKVSWPSILTVSVKSCWKTVQVVYSILANILCTKGVKFPEKEWKNNFLRVYKSKQYTHWKKKPASSNGIIVSADRREKKKKDTCTPLTHYIGYNNTCKYQGKWKKYSLST